MSNMQLIRCPDCGAYNGQHDRECAMCGKQFGIHPHKQDDKGNRRRQKKRFDDEDDEDINERRQPRKQDYCSSL